MNNLFRQIKRIPMRIYFVIIWTFRKIRMELIKPLFQEIGTNVWVDPDGTYSFPTIRIGNDVFLGPRAHISGKDIRIGNKVMFGPDVTVLGGDHRFDVVGKYMYDCKEGGVSKPIIIEDDVWVGAGSIILKGVKLGSGCIVGAGSIVTRDVPPFTVVAGNPAVVIRKRFKEEDLKKHLEIICKHNKKCFSSNMQK